MISSSKLAALRLSLQPLSCFANTPTFGPAPTPAAPFTPALTSASQQQSQAQQQQQRPHQELQIQPPKRLRLSPVPDSLLCSPTPTRAAFLLTPTRFALPHIPSPSESEAASPFLSQDPRSPMLSTCVCEGCDNVVSSERNTCTNCRDVFLSLLAHQKMGMSQMQLRSPAQPSPKRFFGGPLSPSSVKHTYSTKEQMAARELTSIAEQRSTVAKALQQPLSVAHPRPTPIETYDSQRNNRKLSRKLETELLEDLGSPDALYFGKRSRRTYGHTSRTSSISVEPLFLNLKTSSRIQKVQDEDMSA